MGRIRKIKINDDSIYKENIWVWKLFQILVSLIYMLKISLLFLSEIHYIQGELKK